ncbi:hypothetical protein L917_18946 [Phytophthora nicotianae]|uniref:Uncharacterized protein n=1 Tax=Phytophthora nicotianae TaxID=4792 RepID=W2K5X7_PHYNI|nr:hypothetical protein L917_18946 [Phytophthora nicotianae]
MPPLIQANDLLLLKLFGSKANLESRDKALPEQNLAGQIKLCMHAKSK